MTAGPGGQAHREGFALVIEVRLTGEAIAMRVRCVSCEYGIELASDASLRRVTCPSCGSRFSLVGGEGAIADPGRRTVLDERAVENLLLDPSSGAGTLDFRSPREAAGETTNADPNATGPLHLDLTDVDRFVSATSDRLEQTGARTSETTDESPSSDQSSDVVDVLPRMIGRFELISELGAGAFGSVWKALDPTLHRFVALKIPKRGSLDADEADRFFREARAAAQLHHPNIVGVHEVGRDAGRIYIVSDFVDGSTLEDAIQGGPLSFREAGMIAAKIARALHHAHESGVIHRDLKPSNIMVDARGEPIVMDFGLARRETGETSLTLEGRILGTPNYMSPEQAAGQGHRADRRSDIYSLGVVLFRLFTGEVPFRGNFTRLIAQIIEEEPPHPTKLNNQVPRDLATICLKCLRKDPDRRYATAELLAADLTRWLNGEPILARDVGRAERFASWCRRKPALAGMSAAAVVLALSTFVAISVGYVQTRSKLRDSLLSQAKADRQTLDSGRSWSAGLALEEAAKIRPDADLREEYLRVLDLPDFRFESFTPEPRFATKAPALVTVRDGKRALVITHGGELEEVEIGKPATRKVFTKLGKFARSARLSPDGRILVARREHRAATEVWDIHSEVKLGNLKDSQGQEILSTLIAFDSTSRRIAAVYWRDTQSPFLATFNPETLVADWTIPLPACPVDSLNFLPNDWGLALTLITDSKNPEESKQWVEIHRPGHPEILRLLVDSKVLETPANHEPRRLSFHVGAHGTRMAVAGLSGSLKVWDLTAMVEGTGAAREALAFRAQTEALCTVQYSPDGESLSTFGMDGVLRLWDSETGELLVSGPLAMAGEVPWLVARPQWIDRHRIVGESMRGLIVFRVRTPLSRPIRLLRRDVARAAPIPRGLRFAPSEQRLVCGLTHSLSAVVELGPRDIPPKILEGGSNFGTICFNASSDRIIIAKGDAGVTILGAKDGQRIDQKPSPPGLSYPSGVGLDDQGHVLVGGNNMINDMPIGPRFQLWDFDTNRSRLSLDLVRDVPDPRDARKTIEINPNFLDRKLTISPEGTLACLQELGQQSDGGLQREVLVIRLFSLATGAPVDEYHQPQKGPVALSKSARLLAIGQGSRILLIRRERGDQITTLEAREASIQSLAVDDNGRWLASLASREGVIRLWDLSRGVNVATFHISRSLGDEVALSASGRWLASSDGRGRLRIWDLDEVRSALSEVNLAW